MYVTTDHCAETQCTPCARKSSYNEADLTGIQRAETDFFSGEPLAALSTLVYSNNIDLQRSASLTFAEITERGEADLAVMRTK